MIEEQEDFSGLQKKTAENSTNNTINPSADLSDIGWKRFWILKTSEQHQKKQNIEENTNSFIIDRFFDFINKGDIVYLWNEDKSNGIYAWAKVLQPPKKSKENNDEVSVTLQIHALNTPIIKQQLELAANHFSCLTILRNLTGHCFRVTSLEALSINQLIGPLTTETPDNPDTAIDPNSEKSDFQKAGYILDYQFDPIVQTIIQSTLNNAQSINQTVFQKLFVQTILDYVISQQSSTPINDIGGQFLNKHSEWLSNLQSQLTFIKSNHSEVESITASSFLGLKVSKHVLAILTEARLFATLTTGKELIHLRHLLAALLQGVSKSIQSYIIELLEYSRGPSLTDLRQEFYDSIIQLYSQDHGKNLQSLLNKDINTELNNANNHGPLLTKLDSDDASANIGDVLDIEPETTAFAKLLCSVDASPPLAIGLFGEWGSGKTFFMNHVRNSVNDLSQQIRQSSEKEETVYHGKVAQIWFNAWQYQDSNLWASLLNHFFTDLEKQLKLLNPNLNEDVFSDFAKQMSPEKQLRITEQEILLTQKNIDSLEQKVSDSNRYKQHLLRLIDNKADDTFSLGLNDLKNELSIAIENGEDMREFYQQLEHSRKEAPLLKQLGTQLKQHWKQSLITAVILGFFSYFITTQLMMASQYISSITSLILAAIASVSGPVQKVRSANKWLRTFFDSIDQEKILKQKNKKKIIKTCHKKLTNLHKERIKLLQETIYTDSSELAFSQFITGRSETDDYKSQLGLLSTVRRDFSRLNELMTDKRYQSENFPKVDRIILYIDDLDRCEPDKVVEVLQAIHLMMAFKLFMVVVGVDARWLGRSLKQRYPFLVHESNSHNISQNNAQNSTQNFSNKKQAEHTDRNDDPYAASTQDYLEKIFQIPFWLKPMDATKATNMISQLLVSKRTRDKIENDDSSTLEAPEITAKNTSIFMQVEDDKNENAISNISDSIKNKALLSTRSLELSDNEVLYLGQLGGIVGRSPRSVKRFVNLYRILKASNTKARLSTFIDNEEYKVPLLLLAVICGRPKVSELFLNYIQKQSDGEVLHSEISLEDYYPGDDNWRELSQQVKHFMQSQTPIDFSLLKSWLKDTSRFGYREWLAYD